jgi:hypothetical protein
MHKIGNKRDKILLSLAMKPEKHFSNDKGVLLCVALLTVCLVFLAANCKQQSTTPNATPSQNENSLSISCSPSSGGNGTVVDVRISCTGNAQEIKTFGLELTFDQDVFQYERTDKGTLTGNWAAVDGNVTSPGKLIVGGFVGSGTPVAVGGNGSLAIVKIKVIYSGGDSRFTRQIRINNYLDDINGMFPMPTSATFTFIK